MNKVWFFIANPKTINDWNDFKNWPLYEGYYNWGIPNNSRDLKKLNEVKVDDIILCYRAIMKELIGWCKCTRTHYVDNKAGFINRIGIGNKIEKFKKPIKLDELKQMKLGFINEYLDFPKGRSIVKVQESDWDRFKKNVKTI